MKNEGISMGTEGVFKENHDFFIIQCQRATCSLLQVKMVGALHRTYKEMHLPSQAKEWYFLSPANKKYTEGGQSNNANNDGYWETCATDSLVRKDGELIGYKKTLNYIEGKHEKDRNRTEWLMYEYGWDRNGDVRTGTSDDMQWVICKLFKLNNKLIAVEEKEATKFAGPNDGTSSKDLTIQGPEFSSILLDEACKIFSFDKPLACPWPQHDQGTGLPTPTTPHVQRNMFTPKGPDKETNEVVRNTCPTRKHDSHPLPASDQGFMIPHSPNAKSQPQCDQGTMLPAPLPQNDQRTMLPLSTGPDKPNNDENDLAIAPSCGKWPLYPTEISLPPLDGPFESLTEEDLAAFDKPDPGYPQAYVNNKETNK